MTAEVPPMALADAVSPPATHLMRPGIWVVLGAVPVVTVLLLVSWRAWLVVLAALLLAAGVMQLARAINSGAAFASEVWVTFAVAVLGFFPPLLAIGGWALFDLITGHQPAPPEPGELTGPFWTALGMAIMAVPFALTIIPLYLATRRFVTWCRHPELLSIEATAEALRRGLDGTSMPSHKGGGRRG